MQLTVLETRILGECAADDVGLWSIIVEVNGASYGDHTKLPDEVRVKTLDLIKNLLQAGLIQAGNFERGPEGQWHFEPMQLTADEVIAYIRRDWDALGRVPNIGDVCWFNTTPSGEALAKELGLEGG